MSYINTIKTEPEVRNALVLFFCKINSYSCVLICNNTMILKEYNHRHYFLAKQMVT